MVRVRIWLAAPPADQVRSALSTRSIYGLQKLMAKSSTKKRVGRPPTGQSPQVMIRLPKQLLTTIDKLARDQATSRSEIMRLLLTEAIEARKRS